MKQAKPFVPVFCWLACLITLASCHKQENVPAVPELSYSPYVSENDVSFYRRFETGHGGIDLSATREIAIRAVCSGKFLKKLYYHPTSLRWQVNCEIVVGDFAVDCLFEPGNQVSQEVGQAQFDALVADGTMVVAGDLLGRLYLAPDNDIALLHFGVRYRPTTRTDCPLDYCTNEVKVQLQALAQRDHPGWQVCTIASLEASVAASQRAIAQLVVIKKHF